MSARAHILAALRDAGAVPSAADPPNDPPTETTGGAASVPGLDSVDRFIAAVQAASGRVHQLEPGQSVAQHACALFPGATAVCAATGLWPEVDGATDGGEALAMLDLAVAHGRFGVAENGGVWVDEGAGVPRAALWLCKHLVLVVPGAQLVDDMHAAYRRLGAARMPDFGAFISGPSKTADIEQCLVIGAHGPLSLDVLLV